MGSVHHTPPFSVSVAVLGEMKGTQKERIDADILTKVFVKSGKGVIGIW